MIPPFRIIGRPPIGAGVAVFRLLLLLGIFLLISAVCVRLIPGSYRRVAYLALLCTLGYVFFNWASWFIVPANAHILWRNGHQYFSNGTFIFLKVDADTFEVHEANSAFFHLRKYSPYSVLKGVAVQFSNGEFPDVRFVRVPHGFLPDSLLTRYGFELRAPVPPTRTERFFSFLVDRDIKLRRAAKGGAHHRRRFHDPAYAHDGVITREELLRRYPA